MNTTTSLNASIILIDNPDDNCSKSQITVFANILEHYLPHIAPLRAREVEIALRECVDSPDIKDFTLRIAPCERIPGQRQQWMGEFTSDTKQATLVAKLG